MPRPRLTLGRLMAWIAFAAVNLAFMSPFAGSIGRIPLGLATVLLGVFYALAYLAYLPARDLIATHARPASSRRRSSGPAIAALTLVLATLLTLAIVLIALRNG
jgi:hypothetical protein